MVHWWCPRRNHKNSVKAKKSERPGPTGKEAGKKPQLKKITLREGSDWTMSEVDLLNLEEETAGAAKFFYVGDDVTLNAFPGVVLAFVVLICESLRAAKLARVNNNCFSCGARPEQYPHPHPHPFSSHQQWIRQTWGKLRLWRLLWQGV